MENFFYRVGKGETVFSLAQKFHIPQTLIVNENNLKRELQDGDLLLLPRPSGRLYTVQPNDTLEIVSEKFNLPKDKISSVNKVDYLFYGLQLIMPD